MIQNCFLSASEMKLLLNTLFRFFHLYPYKSHHSLLMQLLFLCNAGLKAIHLARFMVKRQYTKDDWMLIIFTLRWNLISSFCLQRLYHSTPKTRVIRSPCPPKSPDSSLNVVPYPFYSCQMHTNFKSRWIFPILKPIIENMI